MIFIDEVNMGFGWWKKTKNFLKKVGSGIANVTKKVVKGVGGVLNFAKDNVLPVVNQLAPVLSTNPLGAKVVAGANLAGGVYDQLRTQSRKIKLS